MRYQLPWIECDRDLPPGGEENGTKGKQTGKARVPRGIIESYCYCYLSTIHISISIISEGFTCRFSNDCYLKWFSGGSWNAVE